MKKIIIIVAAVLVLLIASVFGLAMFAPTVLPGFMQNLLGVAPEAAEKPDKKVEERPPPGSTTLIDLEPLTVPIIKDGEIARFLIIHILVEARPGPGEAVIQAKIPYILDAYITYIHALAALDIKPGVADRQFLKERLLVKTKEIVGGDIVVDLLFRNIFERAPG